MHPVRRAHPRNNLSVGRHAWVLPCSQVGTCKPDNRSEIRIIVGISPGKIVEDYFNQKRGNHLDVFLRRANGVHATWIMRETGDPASVQIADLLLGAIIIDLAFDWLAADLIIFGVTEEAGFAGTRCGMIVRLAFGVTTAEHQVAGSTAFRLNGGERKKEQTLRIDYNETDKKVSR